MGAKPAGGGRTIYWIIATVLGAIGLRIYGWLALQDALFCRFPAFEDAIHRARAFHILHSHFPEEILPWGSPAYPYFLALVERFTGDQVIALLPVQLALGLITALLVAWALAPVLPRALRWVAALLFAIHPLGLFFEMRLTPIALASAVLLIALRLVFYSEKPRARGMLWGGLLLGIGCLLKPLLFLALAAAGLWMLLRPRAGRPRVVSAAILLGAFLVLPTLLCGQHARLADSGPALNWSGAVAFYQTLQPESRGAARAENSPTWMDPSRATALANEAAGAEQSLWETHNYFRGRALRQLAERPIAFIGAVLYRAALLFSGPELPDPVSPGYLLRNHARALIWGLYLFPLLLAAAILGFWQLWRTERRHQLGLPLIALAAANLIGTQSAASRWLLVVAALPVIVVGLRAIPAAGRALIRPGSARLMLPIAAIALILSACDLPRARARHDNPSEDLRIEAGLLIKAQDQRGALQCLKRAVVVDPDNARAHADLANLHVTEQLLGAAREGFTRALEIDPTQESALYGLSELLRSQGSYAEAETTIERLLHEHPRHPLYLNQLGAILMQQGKFDQARRALRTALAIAPNYQVALVNLRAAEQAEQQATTLAFPEEMTPTPGSPLWQIGQRAIGALRTGEVSLADSLTRAALAQFPDELMSSYMRGAFLLESRSPAEALPLLLHVITRAPGRAITTQMAARAHLAAGDKAAAMALATAQLAQAADERNRVSIEELLGQLRRAQ